MSAIEVSAPPVDDRANGRRRALRFLMAGSVDDGKSTLTGRLLFESQAILGDQLGKLRDAGAGDIDFSLLTDGLEAEREQGITIDVAYRYFSTPRRKFIIADAPGHEQYTRNMVTAAAGSDAAIALIDITKLDLSGTYAPLLEQTRRHAMLVRLLRVPTIIFAVNKIDAVEEPERAFSKVRGTLQKFAAAANMNVAGVVPISARRGDNVTTLSERTPWYDGPSLLELLEGLPADEGDVDGDLLVPIQYVGRDESARVLWGRVARGIARAGERITVLPSNERATIREVRYAGECVEAVEPGRSAGLILDRHVDVARGSWISGSRSVEATQRFSVWLAWMDVEPAQLNRKYLIRHGSRWVQGRIVSIESALDVHTLEPVAAHALEVNEIGRATLETQEPLPIEPYERNGTAGAMIVVDPATHHTSGVVLVTNAIFGDRANNGRSSARVPVAFSLLYKTDRGDVGTARIENMSIGGLLMTCDSGLELGGVIEIQLQSRDVIPLKGRVISDRPSASGGHHYHISFHDVDIITHERLVFLTARTT